MRKLSFAALLLLASTSGQATPPAPASPVVAAPAASATGVVLAEPAQLEAGYWVRRLVKPGRLVMDARAIAAQNADLHQRDPSLHDIWSLPARLSGTTVRGWVQSLSTLPKRTLWDAAGTQQDAAALAGFADTLALDPVPTEQPTRYGLVVARGDLRTFPTRVRVFSELGDTDIDRFQESALFPGTPVVIAHASRDGQWLFVVSPFYAAWIEKTRVAEGGRQQVFDYVSRSTGLVVTGANTRTVFTPEQPAVSELRLDMGIQLPVLEDWPADRPVNGQGPAAAHVIELPVRNEDGSLALMPALVPRSAEVETGHLPLTEENIIRQAFKFLGERYGWGHAYEGRDCSGFVSEVYRSMGVQLPRNSHDQGVSPALNRIAFTDRSNRKLRQAAIDALQVGDLVYIPGHVMMVIGRDDRGVPFVIHDTAGASVRDAGGALRQVVLNGVSVTPLPPLLFNETQSYVDRMYSIQRIRPRNEP